MKQHPKFKDILVGEDGKVFSKSQDKILPTHNLTRGYIGVHIRENKGSRPVHRLVAETYLTESPHYGDQVNHKNGIKDDNHLTNLEWCNNQQNIQHAVDTGLMCKGEDVHRSNFTNEQVHTVCKMLQDGFRNIDIANEFGVKPCVISKIRKRQAWNHISKDYEFTHKRRLSLSPETVHFICQKLEEGKGVNEISSLLPSSVHPQEIRRIGRKEHWTSISDLYDIKYKPSLTESEVHLICQELEKGVKITEIMKRYGFTKGHVDHIAKKRSWVKISSNYSF